MKFAAGAGSVILLWGTATDDFVELRHLKAPAEAVDNLPLVHDHIAGTTTLREFEWDAIAFLRSCGPAGATVGMAAQARYHTTVGSQDPKYRVVARKLSTLVKKGYARKTEAASVRRLDISRLTEAILGVCCEFGPWTHP